MTVIERMLLLDPESRVTAAAALALPYFSEFREPEEETEAQPYDHSVDNSDLPLEQWKRKEGKAGTEPRVYSLAPNGRLCTETGRITWTCPLEVLVFCCKTFCYCVP